MPYHPFGPDANRELPNWIYCGGFALSFLAGYINVSMLYVFAVPVSHMSGAVSRMGMDLGNGHFADLGLIAAIVLFFALGAIVSGFAIVSNDFTRPYHYRLILIAETTLLLLAAMLTPYHQNAAIALSAMACGMQNSMASSFNGLIIRTTHVTGIVTDLGFIIGSYFRTGKLKPWKIILLILLLLGYLSGGIFSAFIISLMISGGYLILIYRDQA